MAMYMPAKWSGNNCGCWWSGIDLASAYKEDTMKDEKRYEWEDVTRECEAVLDWWNGGYFVAIRHPDMNGMQIPLYADGFEGGKSSLGFRAVPSDSPNQKRFRIERRVEVEPAPFVFKYTPEFVQNLRCSEMSDESVLVHCVAKWGEVIAAHEAGVEPLDIGSSTCPACEKYKTCGGCDSCPLGATGDASCCGNTHGAYAKARSATTARAVRDYIQTKLLQIRVPVIIETWQPKKVEPWQPQAWEPVSCCNKRWYVVGENTDALYLLFRPEGGECHGGGGNGMKWGSPVPGCKNHHWWERIRNLTPIKDDSC